MYVRIGSRQILKARLKVLKLQSLVVNAKLFHIYKVGAGPQRVNLQRLASQREKCSYILDLKSVREEDS
jgi:hypothetical protein